MVVTNKAHRDKAEQIWKAPGRHHSGQTRLPRGVAEPDAEGRAAKRYWVQVNNNLQAGANSNEEIYLGYRNPENFIVVPTPILR